MRLITGKWSRGLQGPLIVDINALDNAVRSSDLGEGTIWRESYVPMMERRRKSIAEVERIMCGCDHV